MTHALRKIRRLALAIAAVAGAAAPAAAGPEAMDVDEARHLLSRTGFGAAPHEISSTVGLSYAEGVDRILAGLDGTPSKPMPAWTEAWGYPAEEIWSLGPTVAEFFEVNRAADMEGLRAWWLSEMITTPNPMTERLTLFWHDHFATSFFSSSNAQWMANQHRTFRSHSAGNFNALTKAVMHDPAMLDYLTNLENTKAAPNENLAREFFELFTLGQGRGYKEADIKEAARALTGHTVSERGEPGFHFNMETHDFGRKTIFGTRGRFDAEALVDLTLSQEEFGPYIVEKFWLEFVSDTPDPSEIARLSALWKDANLDLKPLLRALLTTDAFWDPDARGRLVKSPTELVVGTIRSLGLTVEDYGDLGWALEEMGQALFAPPNVAGWSGGTAWINDATASARAMVLSELLQWRDAPELSADAAATAPMMMLSGSRPRSVPAPDVGPHDLRVGQVFAVVAEAEREEDEEVIAHLMTLFDVSFAGHTWRSLSIWVELFGDDEAPYFAIFTGDCQPDCFATWPGENDAEDQWIGFTPHPELRGDVEWVATKDRELIAALATHLPMLLEQTRDQYVWLPQQEEDGETYQPAEFRDVMRMVKTARRATVDLVGSAKGKLVLAASAPGRLGLNGMTDYATIESNFEDLAVEIEEAARTFAAEPAVYFRTSAAWFADLPGTGPVSRRAEGVLLAVPLPAAGARTERIVGDPDALLRRIVLSPQYQVN
ncbi:MAG: DUF1800 domain-containing protein [Pseudomonadota bacterium]